jgi:hypothetical protein
MAHLNVGDRGTYLSPYTEHKGRIGQPFTVKKYVTEPIPGEYDEEALPMYEITFEDGIELSAYPEEVEPDEIARQKASGVPYVAPREL